MGDPYLSKMAYWVMCRAIERDPKSKWAEQATEQWLRYCEQERRADGQSAPAKAE